MIALIKRNPLIETVSEAEDPPSAESKTSHRSKTNGLKIIILNKIASYNNKLMKTVTSWRSVTGVGPMDWKSLS